MGENGSAKDPSRRKFLNRAWKWMGLGLAVEAGWTTYDILRPRASGAFGGMIDAGDVEDYPPGTIRYFFEGRFFVSSVDGTLVALYQKCPHLGCRVPFCDSSGLFECPCHGSIFNAKGEYLRGPAPRGMDRFPLRIEGDQVVVETSTVIEGPPRGELTAPGEPRGPSCIEGEPPGEMKHEDDEGEMDHGDEQVESPLPGGSS